MVRFYNERAIIHFFQKAMLPDLGDGIRMNEPYLTDVQKDRTTQTQT